MKNLIIFFCIVIVIAACSSREHNEQRRAIEDSITSQIDPTTAVDTVTNTSPVQQNADMSNLEIRVYKNTDMSGYGYDILTNGKPYIHQPNIPAVSGNKGFESEELAKRVAELVVSKIKRNILPPMVDIKELDSLGVK